MQPRETIPILTNINGVALPGTVLAIMGPVRQAAPVTTACIWTTWTNGGFPHLNVTKYE